jgi:hypothetical protein
MVRVLLIVGLAGLGLLATFAVVVVIVSSLVLQKPH